MKKNLFLLPSIIVIFFLCFTTLSCFSGFLEEKGQVTLTFSESSLHNLMARGAVSEEAENDFDFLSDFPNKPKIEYQFYGFEGQFTDIEDFDEEDFDLANAYVLNFYEDSAYEVYSAALLSELAKEQEGMFDNVSEEDIFKNPDFQEMLKDPYAFYEKAIVSKGNWSQSGNAISISETHFFDLQQESLVQSASPKAMIITLDSPGFYISSQSGVSLTFFNESVIDQLDKESEVSDDTNEDDKTTEKSEQDIIDEENFSIVVSLNVGGKVYEKTIDVNESALKDSKTVDFNNLTVGLTAKASVVIYKVSSSDDKKIYAQGEGSEFVIQSGNNPTTIKIKKVVTDEKEPEVKPKPDPDPDPQDKEEEIVIPSGTIVNCYGGQLKDSTTQVANYILALYENKQYAVYEFSDEFLADESNKEKYSFEGVKDLSGIIAVVSRMLENGTVISFGTYTYTTNEYDSYEFKYIEQYYYDKESKTYKASKYGGTSNGALSVEELNFGSQSGTRIVFFPFRSITINDVMPSFNIEIKGFDKNDVTDIDDDYCIVNLYEIKDQTDMTRLKTAYGAETLTDIQRAKILIPVIKNSMETKIARFNPNAADEKNNQGEAEISVDDDGVIHWTGNTYVSNKVGDSYGILATVFFSHRDGLDFYEFDFGYVDMLQIKSGTNDVQLSVKDMNIPCKIKFNYDDNMSDKYQVDTAISDIVMADADGSVRGSVVNEILSAIEETNEALEKDGYEFDNVKTPLCGMEGDIPTVIVFYNNDTIYADTNYTIIYKVPDEKPLTGKQIQDLITFLGLIKGTDYSIDNKSKTFTFTDSGFEKFSQMTHEELDTFADGKITTGNYSLVINCDVGKLYRNNGQISLSAEKADGKPLSTNEKNSLEFNVKMYYGGNLVASSDGSYTYDDIKKMICLNQDQPLLSGGNYQLFVESSYVTDYNETIINSQTFNIFVDDYLYYDCSLDTSAENYLDIDDPESEFYKKLTALFNEQLYLKFSGSGDSQSLFIGKIIGSNGLIKDLSNVSVIFDFEEVTGVETLFGKNAIVLSPDSVAKIEKLILPDSIETIEPACFTGDLANAKSGIVLSIGKNVASLTSPWQESYSPFKGFELSSENPNFVIKDNGKIILSADEKTLILAANSFMEPYTIPDSVVTVGEGAFCGTSTLITINFNNVTRIGQYAFKNCNIGDNNSNWLNLGKVEIIDNYAFSRNYIYVTFPKTLKAIGVHALPTSNITFDYSETYQWEYVYGENARDIWEGWISAGNCENLPESNCGVMEQSSFTKASYEAEAYMKYVEGTVDYYFYRKSN